MRTTKLRVIAGNARRLQLKTPAGEDTRPTLDRVKETLFNILQNDVPGSVFVDLFSGSGSIAIEALSRGAARAYLIENETEAHRCILENLRRTRLADRAVVLKKDVLVGLQYIREKEADLIFMDPPYESGLYARTLEALSGMPYVTAHTRLIAEAPLEMDFSFAEEHGFVVTREKKYKNNKHVFMQREQGRYEDGSLSGEL